MTIDKEQMADRLIGSMTGVAVGDALGQPTEGMTPFEVMRCYGSVDMFFVRKGRPSSDSGRTGMPTQMMMSIVKPLVSDSLKLNESTLSSTMVALSKNQRGWDKDTLECVARMQKEPWSKCGLPDSLCPDFLPKMIPLGLVAAKGGYDDERLLVGCRRACSGTTRSEVAIICGFVLACVIREVVRSSDQLTDPFEFFDGQKSLTNRLAQACRFLEEKIPPGEATWDRPSTRIDFVTRSLQKGVTTDEFFGLNGHGDTCLEMLALSIFCFLLCPDKFGMVTRVASKGRRSPLATALVGSLIGAYAGISFIEGSLLAGLEDRNGIENVATELNDLLWMA